MSSGAMSEKRLFLAKLAEAQDSARGGPKRRAIARTAAVLVILAILVAVILWFSGFFSTPKEVLEIRAMVDQQIGELQKVARNEAPLTYDTSNFRQNWDRVRKMPPEVREQVREEMERLSRAREQAELRSYFAMPAQERLKEIDRRINAEAGLAAATYGSGRRQRSGWRPRSGRPRRAGRQCSRRTGARRCGSRFCTGWHCWPSRRRWTWQRRWPWWQRWSWSRRGRPWRWPRH